MVEVESLSKTFPGKKGKSVHALADVSFMAPAGHVFGLIGDNGAGKTTALRIISTLIEPTSGKAAVCGQSCHKSPIEVRKNLGILSGSTGLYGRLTPTAMLTYFARLFGASESSVQSVVKTAIDRFQIGEFQDRPCDQLSTGQKQRVGLARATIHNPQVILMDEPTNGLDVQSSQSVLEFVEELRTQGKTIIYCSHIMSEVERLCDNLVILHEGKICATGTVNELKTKSGQPTMELAFLNLIGYKKGAAN